jgi:hypothetical protein
MYFGVVLTVDVNKRDCKNKDNEEIGMKIYQWGCNFCKGIDNVVDGPFYDVGDDNDNHHLNMMVESEHSIMEVEKEFLSWINRKGFVKVKKLYDIIGWLKYSSRNDYKDPNYGNRNYIKGYPKMNILRSINF